MRSYPAMGHRFALEGLEHRSRRRSRSLSAGERRRRVVVTLCAVLAATLCCAIAGGWSAAWWVAAALLPITLGYVAVMMRVRRVEFERELSDAFGRATDEYEWDSLHTSRIASYN